MSRKNRSNNIQTNASADTPPLEMPRTEISDGVNSTPDEIKSLGGIHKLRAKIKAKQEAARAAKQPRV